MQIFLPVSSPDARGSHKIHTDRKKARGSGGGKTEVFTLIAKTRTPRTRAAAAAGGPHGHPAGQQKETQTATLDQPPTAGQNHPPPPPGESHSTKCCINVIQYFFNLVAVASYFYRSL